ncbi:transcriptional regulator, TraR/DksA family [Gottschalkia purinilytica]|uniref:Transcriptional regulator, TraR/DksA family n=1 Tax=Gottschalkia purinilytica TaxID=1503 RepID=A0A0L0WB61_GOTPU|nr:TraR/DksA C4-type zinc finger protein [Gottschalkia purinilytica]KNF08726.1 transcriptional regulator, TraR/DksA family [Gottschalkia purinilytica]
MDKEKLEYFRKLLLKEKLEVLKTLNLMDRNGSNDPMVEYSSELSMYDNHPADIGTEMYMMGQNMNLRNNENMTLQKIDYAMERIEKGTYGECEICGKSIESDRLEILPYASNCIRCQEETSLLQSDSEFRPAEEHALKYPFGRTFKDEDKSQNEFDGEDSWQSVAKFNKVEKDPSFGTGDYLGVFDDYEQGIVQEVEKISQDYYDDQL